MNRRTAGASALAGVGWGALAYCFGNEAFPQLIWAGAAVSPLIGLVAGWLYRSACNAPLGKRAALSLGTLVLAVTMFGLALGLWDAMRPLPGHASGNRIFWSTVSQAVLGVWWGIVSTGAILAFWPAALITHSLVCRAGRPKVVQLLQ
ncbi:MAG: hypothetical protein C0485_17260, partial [Pirellula sp.]|nr:hypothetical protein [Pirellula sp.]